MNKKKFIEYLSKFHSDFKKFFALKILGKQYIRTGQCNTCGKCCQEIYIRHGNGIINEEEQFERLKTMHYFYGYLKVIDKTETGLVFACTKVDKETGKCTAYNTRALLCRVYPQEEIFMMGGSIAEECGYKFEPIEKFDEVFNKIKKA